MHGISNHIWFAFLLLLLLQRNRCDGVYDEPVLEHVMAWKDQVLLRWIALLLHGNEKYDATISGAGAAATNHDTNAASKARQQQSLALPEESASGVAGGGGRAGVSGGVGSSGEGSDAAYGWAQRLGLAVHEALCSARIAELFDIIADYPDSAVAIGELKVKGEEGLEGGAFWFVCFGVRCTRFFFVFFKRFFGLVLGATACRCWCRTVSIANVVDV